MGAFIRVRRVNNFNVIRAKVLEQSTYMQRFSGRSFFQRSSRGRLLEGGVYNFHIICAEVSGKNNEIIICTVLFILIIILL